MEELAKEMREELLLEEAKRCLKCKVAKYKKACPISTDIPTIMNLFLEGNKQEAGRVFFENNPLSAICSIVCPHENNCKGNCILGMKKTSVDFYKIEQYLSGKYIDDFDICPICNWEDDSYGEEYSDSDGVANTISLNEARCN